MDDRSQQYCQHCGNRIRTDTSYCVVCGNNLAPDSEGSASGNVTPPPGSRKAPAAAQSGGEQDITPQIALTAVALVSLYVMIRHSVLLGILILILSLVGIGWYRKMRGTQTDFERQVFGRLPEYKQRISTVSQEASSRYREWDQARVARLREEDEVRAAERKRGNVRSDLDQYRRLFQRAYAGSNYFVDWWRAYVDDHSKENSTVPEHLETLRTRSETQLRKVEEVQQNIEQYFGTEEFEEKARRELNTLKVGQENFNGSQTIFTSITAVHNDIKETEGWTRFQEEFESFAKELEDILGSSAVRTEAANRIRFPNPAAHGQTREFRCPTCGSGNSPGANFCYSCGTTLSAVAGNPRQSNNLAASTSGTTYVLISIPFAVVALFLFPPVFGGIGIFFGYKAMQAGNEGGGIAMMAVNGACLLFGMLSGMMFWGF